MTFQDRYRSRLPCGRDHSLSLPRRSVDQLSRYYTIGIHDVIQKRNIHCMLLSRGCGGLGQTFCRIHLPYPKSHQSYRSLPANLRSLYSYLQLQGRQHKPVYQTLLLRPPSSFRQILKIPESFCPLTALEHRSFTTMAAPDRSILPDTYVLSSIAGCFH